MINDSSLAAVGRESSQKMFLDVSLSKLEKLPLMEIASLSQHKNNPPTEWTVHEWRQREMKFPQHWLQLVSLVTHELVTSFQSFMCYKFMSEFELMNLGHLGSILQIPHSLRHPLQM